MNDICLFLFNRVEMLSLDQMELDLKASFSNYKLDLGNKRQRHCVSKRRKWQPSAVFSPGEFHGQRSLVGYSPWGRKELDMTERLSLPPYPLCLTHQFRLLQKITIDWVTETTFVSHNSGGWKSKVKWPAELASGENVLPGLLMFIFLLCPLMVECRERREEASCLFPLLIRALPSLWGFTLMN